MTEKQGVSRCVVCGAFPVLAPAIAAEHVTCSPQCAELRARGVELKPVVHKATGTPYLVPTVRRTAPSAEARALWNRLTAARAPVWLHDKERMQRAVRAEVARTEFGQRQRWAGEELAMALETLRSMYEDKELRRERADELADAMGELCRGMLEYVSAARVCSACGLSGEDAPESFLRGQEECTRCRPAPVGVAIARAAERVGPVVELDPPVRCCDILWTSHADRVPREQGGWTRTGECGKCGKQLASGGAS